MAFRTRVWSLGRFLIVSGALVATFLVCAVVAARVAVRAREVTVPDVTGATIMDAAARLSAQQLSLRIDTAQRASADVPAGRILGQEPRGGEHSRRMRTVRVWVSSGAKVAHMPQLVGQTERAARIRLSQEGVDEVTVSEIKSNLVVADEVLAQDPPAGQPATAVRLLVSRGADVEGYVMPDVIGLESDAAAAFLRQRGFRVSVVSQYASSGLPPGTIVRQTPAGGFEVQPGDAISFEVAR